jgi:hypothetical protein
VIFYLWEAVACDVAVPLSSLGVSDDDGRARGAAEDCLRSGRARLAYVESACLATSAVSLTRDYVRTGSGWWATPDPAGGVAWVKFADPVAAAGLRALAESAGWGPDADGPAERGGR